MASIEPARPGLKFYKNKASGLDTASYFLGVVATNNGTAIFNGDPVKKVSDGSYIVANGTDTADAVCVGVERYRLSDGTTRPGNFLPAATTYTGNAALNNPLATVLKLIPLKGNLFTIAVDTGQADAATAQGLMFSNCTLNATAGSTTTGNSNYTVAASTIAATNTLSYRLVSIPQFGFSNPSINDVTSANWLAVVEANLTSDVNDGTTTGT